MNSRLFIYLLRSLRAKYCLSIFTELIASANQVPLFSRTNQIQVFCKHVRLLSTEVHRKKICKWRSHTSFYKKNFVYWVPPLISVFSVFAVSCDISSIMDQGSKNRLSSINDTRRWYKSSGRSAGCSFTLAKSRNRDPVV